MEDKNLSEKPTTNTTNSFFSSQNSVDKSNSEKSEVKNPPKFIRMKSSFFGSSNSKGSSFFGPSKTNSWIDDRPAGETLSEFYETRKKIIFKKINVINNQKEFAKLILDSQTKANNIIKTEGLFSTPREVYDWAVELKENIANYFLVINSYLNAKRDNTAYHLFLLLDMQNREKFDKIFEQIRKNFKNMSNSNRIGKFYPSIIRFFIQILSIVIKYSVKFNKIYHENFYLKKYLLTIDIVKNTVANRFIAHNPGPEYDFKNLGRFFFFDCVFKQGIYSFIRYQSFDIIIDIFIDIIEKYRDIDDMNIINLEQILLLKTTYNLGLLLYVTGNIPEALSKIDESLEHLKNIYYFPYKITEKIEKNILPPSSNNSNIKSYNDKTNFSSINIDESTDRILNSKTTRKRSISTKMDHDTSFKQKEIYFRLKNIFQSAIQFGKNKIEFLEDEKNVETYIRDQINIEIELVLSEIELNKNSYERAYDHIDNILNLFNVPISKFKNKYAFNKLKEIDRSSIDSRWNKNKKDKRNIELSDLNRRRICYILQKIETDLEIIRNKSVYQFNIDKSLEEVKDSSSNESYSSRNNYSSYIINKRSDKERKLINAVEKFFIFICSLSLYQLKTLNQFQPKKSQKRNELPILFPNQFKDCLNFTQRLALNYLDTMSLSRCTILIDSNKDISPENLNYLLLTKEKKINRKKSVVLEGLHRTGYYKNLFKKINKKNNKKNSMIHLSNNNITMNLNTNKDKYGFKYNKNLGIINNNNNNVKKDLKKKLFIQGQFQKFMEEDENFNNKIEKIIMDDNDKIKINRSKIYTIMNRLNSEEKALLMQDQSYIESFVKQIKKKIKRKSNSCKK